jgi:putative AlgH/UPF0301 family transcriptional regulator
MSLELQNVKDSAFKQSLIVPAKHKDDNAWGIPLNSLSFYPTLQDVWLHLQSSVWTSSKTTLKTFISAFVAKWIYSWAI